MTGHPRFKEVLQELQDLHDRKNSDYAQEKRPLSNLQMCEEMGLPAWIGVIIRLGDKYSRLVQLARKYLRGESAAVKEETVADTFRDNAVYSILGMILYEEASTK